MSTLPSTLDAVTVSRDGALCRRVARVEGAAARVLRFGGLPLSLDAGSLRARVVSGGGRVVDVRPQYDVKLADEVDVPEEQRALEEAAVRLAQLQVRRQRLNVEITELQQLKPIAPDVKRGEPPRPAPVEATLALGDFAEAELVSRHERRRALDVELEEAQRELQLRQRRVQEASTAKRSERAQLSRVAVVTLAEPPAGPVELELEYRVPGARWVPSYALTLQRGMASGVLQMRASVAQNTGEDWADVKLSLSTALPTRRADMPELKALKLGRRQEAPARSGWREPPPGLDALFDGYDAVMGPPRSPQAAPPPPPSQPVMAMSPPPPPAPPGMVLGGAPMPAPRGGGGPPMAPRPMAAPSMSMSASAPMTRSREMAREEAAPKSALPRRSAALLDAEEAPMAEEGAADAFADGGAMGPPEPEPQGLAGVFGDYARLAMTGPETTRRGRLVAAPEWSAGVFVGVSVQLDVAVTILARAQRAANEVAQLTLPPLCTPVTAIRSFDYRYDCGARLDVPSTGKWVLVPVMTCAVGLTPEFVCVPSVEPKVYRTLTIANRSPHALLPGPVDVTAGDEFLMTTTLPAIPPGAESSHRLGLGVEEAIKVSRKTHYKETTGGFLGGSTVLPHDVEIELNNRLATPALVEVRERVPVPDPAEKDLKVEEANSTPPWERVDEPIDGALVKGARRWRVTVPPGQPLKLTASFAIRMPADKMLVGGNRRN